MNIGKRHRVLFTLGLLFSSLLLTGAASPSRHYTIATGSMGATFYPVASALCDRVEKLALDFTCEAVSTAGSAYNLRQLQAGQYDLALSQASMQYQAWQGLPPFSQPHQDLRTVAALYKEIFIIAARPESRISGIGDLQNQRVNLGNIGSGSQLINRELLEFLNIDLSSFRVYNYKSAELPRLLCNGEIDAALYSTGHPNVIYQRLVEECGVELVDLWNEKIAEFVTEREQYSLAVIPGGTYKGVGKDKQGIGLHVVLSAHRDVAAEHVSALLDILLGQREQLAREVRVFATVEPASTPQLEAIAPLHPGALEYFRDNRSNDTLAH